MRASSIWFQLKNYRKPLLQRYVVRILLMVPIYAITSWVSMISLTAAAFLDPIRDIYEAFTIYTFLQLLINYLEGERALIIMTHGRAPVHHLWPLNHVLSKVDISDPHTFLAIKRGILQYAWLKPILSLAAIIMKATGTYQEGYIGLNSGYLWSGIIYNISVSVSLYALGLFWVCMHNDLVPFRPVPKFLCIKLIIFASYWQGFFLSILVWLGAIPDDVEGYTSDNLAAAIQDAMICCEMPFFAIAHWYAFSWHDYANNTVSSARMPVKFAFRDAFGIVDLIEDSKDTFRGDKYNYRKFDSSGKVIAHEDSSSRFARMKEGMRYSRGGEAKYWIPKPGQVRGEVSANTPLLGSNGGPSGSNNTHRPSYDDGSLEETSIDKFDERLYDKARELEFGDFNVSTAHRGFGSCSHSMLTPSVVPRDHSKRAQQGDMANPGTRSLPVEHRCMASRTDRFLDERDQQAGRRVPAICRGHRPEEEEQEEGQAARGISCSIQQKVQEGPRARVRRTSGRARTS
ncbi:organic solute transporter Ostalpha-domain-containing protein [Microdochium bolleyi]|uniref:Organic solute transporter Ostalpha-domain-containing protein n=1 Tax=Microdochium bolleyi TaxID=196109 RepID=A0A136J5K2_9PEZI|nr:organic solute transporter Ostalpha-domain-containing protein [Microdochium bolleyi]